MVCAVIRPVTLHQTNFDSLQLISIPGIPLYAGFLWENFNSDLVPSATPLNSSKRQACKCLSLLSFQGCFLAQG